MPTKNSSSLNGMLPSEQPNYYWPGYPQTLRGSRRLSSEVRSAEAENPPLARGVTVTASPLGGPPPVTLPRE